MKAIERMDKILKLAQMKNQAAIKALHQQYSSIGGRTMFPLSPEDAIMNSFMAASKYNILIDEEFTLLNQELAAVGKEPLVNPLRKEDGYGE